MTVHSTPGTGENVGDYYSAQLDFALCRPGPIPTLRALHQRDPRNPVLIMDLAWFLKIPSPIEFRALYESIATTARRPTADESEHIDLMAHACVGGGLTLTDVKCVLHERPDDVFAAAAALSCLRLTAADSATALEEAYELGAQLSTQFRWWYRSQLANLLSEWRRRLAEALAHAEHALEEQPRSYFAAHGQLHVQNELGQCEAAANFAHKWVREGVEKPSFHTHHVDWHRAIEWGALDQWAPARRMLDERLLGDVPRPYSLADCGQLLIRMQLAGQQGLSRYARSLLPLFDIANKASSSWDQLVRDYISGVVGAPPPTRPGKGVPIRLSQALFALGAGHYSQAAAHLAGEPGVSRLVWGTTGTRLQTLRLVEDALL